jgi:uncharacterized 2Fe-2S/4Fe-4S cluster protein (DUF4445 family)
MSSITAYWDQHSITIEAADGQNLLDVLRENGIPVSSPCGGHGKCGKCQVRLRENATEHTVLACQTIVTADCDVYLDHPSSISTKGADGLIETETVADKLVENDAASDNSIENDTFADKLMGNDTASDHKSYGVAVDLGTTTVVLKLFELSSGTELDIESDWNAQLPYGADVISRVQYCITHPDGLKRLSDTIQSQICTMLRSLACKHGIDIADIHTITLAGNTIMQHIFAEIDPSSIAAAPYTPQTLFDDHHAFSMKEYPQMQVILSPCIAGYVGGDIVAGLLSSRLSEKNGTYLFLDIGTNGEMALKDSDGFLCCSVASGPAFEGAEITCGMASHDGAINHISWAEDKLHIETVNDAPPVGLCGSGLLDLLAILLETEVVDETGRLLPPDEAEDEVPDALLACLEEDEQENGIFYLTADRNVYLTASDVRKLQLAKAAVAAGISVLLSESGHTLADIDALYIAGGFGKHLNPNSIAAIGMIPSPLKDKIIFLGNSSLAGACQTLLQPDNYDKMLDIQHACRYLELSGNQAFSTEYIEQMMFE